MRYKLCIRTYKEKKEKKIMIVGYAVLYKDGTLVISKKHSILSKKVRKDYGQFEDTNVPWGPDCLHIKIVQILDSIKSNWMYQWFAYCRNLTTLIGFENLDVSDCKNFSNLFTNCNHLINIKSLESWNVSNGRNFSYMFYYCEHLQNIQPLETWNVSSGTNFIRMFCGCEKITTLEPLRNWNVSNGTLFGEMFQDCINLVDISAVDQWNISKGKDIEDMFD